MKQTISKTHTLSATVLAAFLFIYVVMFILYHVKPDSIFSNISEPISLFTKFKFIIPICILAISNTLYLGKCIAKDDLEALNYKYVSALEIKKKELINYITLARMLHKKDNKELMDTMIWL